MSDISPSITTGGVLLTPPADAAHGHGHGHGHSNVAHQFDDAAQQKEAATLGMWAFLATEVMFFGAAFLLYTVYRHTYIEGFTAASRKENWIVGGINTAVLLISSLTVVLAVRAAHMNDQKWIHRWLVATVILGATFVGIKGYEYHHLYVEHLIPIQFDFFPEFDSPHVGEDGQMHRHFGPMPEHATLAELATAEKVRHGARIFFSFYFCATGLHALHMIIGIGVMLYIMKMVRHRRFNAHYYNPVEISGLYWHFVDIVWIFLYPMLYLIDLSKHAGGH